ncbi:hypothetical protein KO116_03269 [Halomonas sp. KO116]|nr:hypothetical protein KO116_03269 [Halomonas sp. KO116]
MSLPAPQPNAWISFLAHLLFILAAWTLVHQIPVSRGLRAGLRRALGAVYLLGSMATGARLARLGAARTASLYARIGGGHVGH